MEELNRDSAIPNWIKKAIVKDSKRDIVSQLRKISLNSDGSGWADYTLDQLKDMFNELAHVKPPFYSMKTIEGITALRDSLSKEIEKRYNLEKKSGEIGDTVDSDKVNEIEDKLKKEVAKVIEGEGHTVANKDVIVAEVNKKEFKNHNDKRFIVVNPEDGTEFEVSIIDSTHCGIYMVGRNDKPVVQHFNQVSGWLMDGLKEQGLVSGNYFVEQEPLTEVVEQKSASQSFTHSIETKRYNLEKRSGEVSDNKKEADKEVSHRPDGKKRYDWSDMGRRNFYEISSHDGVKANPDGSRFYDMVIVHNKKDRDDIIKRLQSEGYVGSPLEIYTSAEKKRDNGEVELPKDFEWKEYNDLEDGLTHYHIGLKGEDEPFFSDGGAMYDIIEPTSVDNIMAEEIAQSGDEDLDEMISKGYKFIVGFGGPDIEDSGIQYFKDEKEALAFVEQKKNTILNDYQTGKRKISEGASVNYLKSTSKEAKSTLLAEYDEDKFYEEEIKFRLERVFNGSGIDMLEGEEYDVAKEADENGVPIKKALSNAGLLKNVEQNIEESVYDGGGLTFYAEDFVNTMNELLESRGKESEYIWEIAGRNMGWRNLSGKTIQRLENFDEMWVKAMPKTDELSMRVEDDGTNKGMNITIYHHDSPTGEFYHYTPYVILAKGTKVKVGDQVGIISEFSGWGAGGVLYFVEWTSGPNKGEQEEIDSEYISVVNHV